MAQTTLQSLLKKTTKNTNKYNYNKVGNSFVGYPLAECVDADDITFTLSSFRIFASLYLGK